MSQYFGLSGTSSAAMAPHGRHNEGVGAEFFDFGDGGADQRCYLCNPATACRNRDVHAGSDLRELT